MLSGFQGSNFNQVTSENVLCNKILLGQLNVVGNGLLMNLLCAGILIMY
jgi:hypothetical protein